jgi:PAS domain S-box-containing protein
LGAESPFSGVPGLEHVALVIADGRGRVAYWSPGATELFGYPADEMVGSPVVRIVPEAFRRRNAAGWRASWDRGILEPSGTSMIPVICADGETRRYASYIFPIRDPHGALVAVGAAWSPPGDGDRDIPPLV